MSSRCASTTTASSPIRWNRAARLGATTARRPLHAACVQPEHSWQPRCDGSGTGRSIRRGAVHRARCRWRVRREELHLCRACADPVGGATRWPAGEVDRHAQRRLCVRPSGARSPCGGGAGAGCGWAFLGLRVTSVANVGAYMAGGVRRGADQPVCPPARQHIRGARCRVARRGGAEQHHADWRHACAGLCRIGEYHGTADRRRGQAMRLRPRGFAPAQHGAGRCHADDQRAWFQRGQRAFLRRPSIAR